MPMDLRAVGLTVIQVEGPKHRVETIQMELELAARDVADRFGDCLVAPLNFAWSEPVGGDEDD